jgi:hypothetical protein
VILVKRVLENPVLFQLPQIACSVESSFVALLDPSKCLNNVPGVKLQSQYDPIGSNFQPRRFDLLIVA